MANYGKNFRLQEEKCVNKPKKIFYYAIQNYYQGLIIYFHGLKIVLNVGGKIFICRM